MPPRADAALFLTASGPTSRSWSNVRSSASGAAMTILKWTLSIVAVIYLGGLSALVLLQRSFMFPIPTRERVAPSAAGFPEVEEHVVMTSDGEKIILWHMPAKPGRPVILFFHGN